MGELPAAGCADCAAANLNIHVAGLVWTNECGFQMIFLHDCCNSSGGCLCFMIGWYTARVSGVAGGVVLSCAQSPEQLKFTDLCVAGLVSLSIVFDPKLESCRLQPTLAALALGNSPVTQHMDWVGYTGAVAAALTSQNQAGNSGDLLHNCMV